MIIYLLVLLIIHIIILFLSPPQILEMLAFQILFIISLTSGIIAIVQSHHLKEKYFFNGVKGLEDTIKYLTDEREARLEIIDEQYRKIKELERSNNEVQIKAWFTVCGSGG